MLKMHLHLSPHFLARARQYGNLCQRNGTSEREKRMGRSQKTEEYHLIFRLSRVNLTVNSRQGRLYAFGYELQLTSIMVCGAGIGARIIHRSVYTYT